MKTIIRPETTSDYCAVAEITARAFSTPGETGNKGRLEMVLVDVLRHGPDFDPELSLVAEVAGAVVGHALFYPYRVWVGGKSLAAVSLHPLTVHPAYQKQGIGGALMAAGHERLKEKGYAFCFLYGHPEYYPRFGYRQSMFGGCTVQVDRANIPPFNDAMTERQIEPDDVAAVAAMWPIWFADTPLAVLPGNAFLDWVSHFDGYNTSVLVQDGVVRGFARYHLTQPEKIRLFLAADQESTGNMLAWLNHKYPASASPTLSLPLHPGNAATQAWLPGPVRADLHVFDAGMLAVLDETNSTIQSYCDTVAAQPEAAGILIYPPYLDGGMP